MKIENGLLNINTISSISNSSKTEKLQHSEAAFGDFLKKALDQVNKLNIEGEEMTKKLVTGEIEDIHQVMIATEKASIALQFTIQVRNKLVEAYQEIMRMQM